MIEADAIAVGGGLAGAAFALELARNDVSVIVLERSRAPALKVCGDFLSAEALDLLAYLGIDCCRLGATPVERLTLAAGKHAADSRLPFRAAGLSRLRLDESLLTAAAAAGARIVRGVAATGLASDGRGAVVEASGTYRARTLALATGKHNLRGWPRRAGTVTAFKLQVALAPAARAALVGRVQLALFDGGYVGACLAGEDLATICWQIETEALNRIGTGWQAQLGYFSSRSPILGDLLAGAKPTTPRPAAVSGLPFGYVRREPIGEGIFPVGDQIAVVPAFTGDGTTIALASGIAAAQAVLRGEPAAAFQATFTHAVKREFALARIVSSVFRLGPTRRLAVAAVGLFPAIASAIARATRLTALPRLAYRSTTTK